MPFINHQTNFGRSAAGIPQSTPRIRHLCKYFLCWKIFLIKHNCALTRSHVLCDDQHCLLPVSSTQLRGDAYSSNMTSNQSASLWKFPSYLMLMNFRSSILTISSLCTQCRSRVSPTVMGLLSKEGNWNTMPSSARCLLEFQTNLRRDFTITEKTLSTRKRP